MKSLTIAGLGALLAANVAFAQAISEHNDLLGNADGKALYTFDKDSAGKSHCSGGCSTVWPPFTAKDTAKDNGKFTVITRDDGSKQWAMDGKPLYFFAADTQPGEAKGDGQGGVWHVVKQSADRKPAAKTTRYDNGYGASSDYGY